MDDCKYALMRSNDGTHLCEQAILAAGVTILDEALMQRLPSASTIGGNNKSFAQFLKDAPIVMGRTWHGQNRAAQGTPITAAAWPFAEFSLGAADAATPDACMIAQQLSSTLCAVSALAGTVMETMGHIWTTHDVR